MAEINIDDLLSAAGETPNLEFKAPMRWERNSSLIKDILAMANIRDGGRIIIGVEDQTLRRIGMNNADIETFDSDIMKDQISNYADPHVAFNVQIGVDNTGLRFIVVTIDEFEEIPVVCKRDGTEVRRGALYYRGQSRRPQSASVESAHEMRDIIERASSKMLKKFSQLGLSVSQNPAADVATILNEELGGL